MLLLSVVSAVAQEVDFNRDVRPLLASQCLACHGPDAETREANLRLDHFEGATADLGEGRRAIDPEHLEKSQLLARIDSTDPDLVMPPADSGRRLTEEQRRLLGDWIRQGGRYTRHWAFDPPRRPAVPSAVEGADPAASPARGPIDAFVRDRLRREQLAPSPEADRATLLRRVTLDLTGLPPTLEETRSFLEDTSPDAYERAVDRLLASPAFGEHWARVWLDLARYADTKGYEKDQPRTIWRYRDWVIDAFNDDLPYDAFTAQQLAGDLLGGESALLATAFHRNTMTNDEGGTDNEEFRVAAVKDRVDSTIQIWMGLTMGCAKCHSHKYDPISLRDYYAFYAIFNQTEDADRPDDAPLAPMPSDRQRARRVELEQELAQLREEFGRRTPELDAEQRAWEAELASRPRPWTPLRFSELSAESSAKLALRGDGAVLASGRRANTDQYTLAVEANGERITAIRLEALKDPSLPQGGPGREPSDQNAVVSELRVSFQPAAGGDALPLELTRPRADFAQQGWPVENAIDGSDDTGWAWSPQNAQPHVAIFDLRKPLEGAPGKLIVTIRQNYPKLALGCLRISTTGAEASGLTPELDTLGELAARPLEERSAAERSRLDDAFRRQREPTRTLAVRIDSLQGELDALRREIPSIPVLRELPEGKRRETRVQQRGNFLDPGEAVEPALLPGLGDINASPGASQPAGRPDRRAVASWLTGADNPLAARVAVNRWWARLFGAGLVETEEDLGTQGGAPTHPELLDWLAVEYRESGEWSLKALLRELVTSATYRQASRVPENTPDPTNRWLARGPRFRLPAEAVRDQALAASGLLSRQLHGASVMPPQPPGLWRAAYSSLKWETSPGGDRYRRGLYTFWRRTSPYPALTTWDAGSGELCLVRRVRTNTPLQALVTLNDPAFFEAAGALGRRMQETAGGVRAQVSAGFQRLLTRAPSDAECARLEQLYESAHRDFRQHPQAARELLEAANQPVDGDDAPQRAAWTVVGNVLLNLDETVMKP